MSKKSKQNRSRRGRPSSWEDDEIRKRDIKIYVEKFYFQKYCYEIAEEYDISKRTVSRAINRVGDNFLDLSSKELLRGAIFAIKRRIKNLTQDLEEEREKGKDDVEGNKSVRSIVELNREIREEQDKLMKLQDIYKERFEIEAGESTRQVLKAITQGEIEEEDLKDEPLEEENESTQKES